MIKTTKVEIFGFGRATGQRDNWLALAHHVQRMTNLLWALWACWHYTNRSADLLRHHLDAYAQWKETKEGDKPK